MSGAPRNDAFASASSSSHSPQAHTPPDDDRDELDFLGDDDLHVLGDDPIHDDTNTPMTFKRKQDTSLLSNPARFFSSLTGGVSGSQHHGASTPPDQSAPFGIHESPRRNNGGTNAGKDGMPLDWHVEGPGRRVGYDDLTAIDWIFEYTKERQRLRVLSSGSSGFMGHARMLLDHSQAWVILVLTGLLVGAIAAVINVVSDWLGDIKTGFCSSGPEGGHFYLNRQFCCFGYDKGAHCTGWKTWAESMGVHSAGGKWFLEYIFFLIFSVSAYTTLQLSIAYNLTGNICILRSYIGTRICHLCQA